ncbi:MAG: orotate phosphoribosyltransferase [Methanosarcinaceae archaeon]|nr:orotate phosphoribosyltransferase [Methanosarcinaceae archaeon]
MMPEIDSEKEKLIAALKECGAVKFGDFILASGKKSKYYIDIKKASTDPRTLRIIAKQTAETIRGTHANMVGGVAVGGIPIATAVSLETLLPLVIIRKSVKDYGTRGRFIGEVRGGSRIILLEDVTTSGSSVMEAIHAIHEAEGTVDTVITVVDREEGAEANLRSIGVELIPLVRASDLV